MEEIRVFLIDEEVLFRQGVRSALSQEDNIEVVGEADPHDDVVLLMEAFCPNVVLMDVGLPLLSGIDKARQITQCLPGLPVILLTAYEDDSQLFQAIKAGAAAFVSKNIVPEELADIIRRVSRGDYPVKERILARPRVADQVLRQFQSLALSGRGMEALAAPLTKRELEILTFVAQGKANKEIAYVLEISEQTIKNHISSILSKLEANDRTHAVVLAIRSGWIKT